MRNVIHFAKPLALVGLAKLCHAIHVTVPVKVLLSLLFLFGAAPSCLRKGGGHPVYSKSKFDLM